MSLRKIQAIIESPVGALRMDRGDGVSTSIGKEHQESVARWIGHRGPTNYCRK